MAIKGASEKEPLIVPLHADIEDNINYARETWIKLMDHNVKHIKIDWEENSHCGDANIVWVCTDVKDRRAIAVSANQSHATFKKAFVEAGNKIFKIIQFEEKQATMVVEQTKDPKVKDILSKLIQKKGQPKMKENVFKARTYSSYVEPNELDIPF